MRDWEKEEKEDERVTLEFFEKLDFSKITEPKSVFLEDWYVLDTIYRIYHHSFKMYHFRDDAINAVKEMLSFVGEEDLSDIPKLLEKWKLDKIFIEAFKNIDSLKFDLSKNEEKIWMKEATALAGCYLQIVGVTYATKKFLYELKVNLENSILSKAGVLESHEALFLETWEAVGSTIRYRLKSDIRNQAKDVVAKKLQI